MFISKAKYMKRAIILHNPGAGEETHKKNDLKKMIEKNGYTCSYYAIKKDDSWINQLDQTDFVVIAGGDGTIRRVVKELTKRSILDIKLPLAILPMGTANNISKTLGINSDLDYSQHISNWINHGIQSFDIGIVKEKKNNHLFLEAAGFGVFPLLIQEMDKRGVDQLETREEEFQLALEVLHELILTSPATNYTLEINNQVYTGASILLEVLNTPYIGPNLKLSSQASINDGLLHVVCIEENQRANFANYIQDLMANKPSQLVCKTFEAEKLTITYDNKLMHIDDELITTAKKPIHFEIRKKILDFIV